jgi:hypothetical protein
MRAVSILKHAIIANDGSFRLIIFSVFLKSLFFFDILIMIGEGFGT